MIGWAFPLNNEGQEQGPNHSGIETFLDSPMSSLARETCQNTCDAALSEAGGPVEIHYQLDLIDPSDLPGRGEFAEAIDACARYWATNRKGKLLFDKARELIEADTIPVLRVSDYNTEGLTGSGGPQGRSSNWHNLVKTEGASDKVGGKLGSFGIGKFAPFACSSLRTVFYSSLDKDGSRKFQGVSILATHENPSGQTTQNTGYFGRLNGFAELSNGDDIPEYFRRTKVGTDIFIAGFAGAENWQQQIIHALLDNFFKAIHDGNLVVRVGDTRINKTSLAAQLHSLSAKDKALLSPQYYLSMTDPAKMYYKNDFDGLGTVELYLLSRPGFPKRIAMVRRSGMVVFHKGHFRTPIRFAGVLQIQGLDADEFFQAIEPPAHDRWEAARYEDEGLAAKRIRQLYSWINERVRELSAGAHFDREDVPGVSRYLPDDEDQTDLPFDQVLEGDKTDSPLSTRVELNPRQREQVSTVRRQDTLHETGGDEGGEDEGGGEWTGDGEPNDGEGGVPPGGGTGGRGGRPGDVGGGSDNPGAAPVTRRTPLQLNQQRCFCVTPSEGRYELIFTSPTEATAFLQLRSIGESEAAAVTPQSARALTDGRSLGVSANGEIGPIDLTANERCRVEVTLLDHVRCALEITANEDNV